MPGFDPPPAPTLPSDIVVTILEPAVLNLSAKTVAEGGTVEITATAART